MKKIYDSKGKCTGCGACQKKCPKNAIQLKMDEKGFLYPVVDESKCINCGICEKTCPIKNYQECKNNPICLAVKHKNDAERLKSSSGSFFIEIARYVINNSGVVYGVIFDDNFVVRHTRATNMEEIEKMRGSKYVQSITEDLFLKVKEDLKNDKQVLFNGTPCQVAGLKMFLGKYYDNLITCDNVCHGVGSPKLFKEYKNKLEKKYNSKLEKVNFRYKNNDGDHNLSIQIKDKEIIKRPNCDEYYKMFTDDLNLRDSCLECSFANINRKSDITMGDFWGIENVLKGFKDDKGCSIILLNSEKGREIFNAVKSHYIYKEVDLDKSIQPQLKHPVEKNNNYDAFWKDYQINGYNFIAKKYGKLSLKMKIKRIIKKSIRVIKK